MKKWSLKHIKSCRFSSTSILSNDFKNFSRARNETRIIVIGAGLAGLSAASHLISQGFQNTVILEATNRIGGRINSKEFGDTLCELGAKWITIDASSDSMHDVVKKATGFQKKIDRSDVMYVNSHGKQVEKDISELVANAFNKIICGRELERKYPAGSHILLSSVQKYFDAEIEKVSKSKFKQNPKVANDIFSILVKDFSSSMGASLEFVNIDHILKLSKSYFNSLYIPAGLANIPDQVASNIAVSQLRIGKPVGEIRWTNLLPNEQMPSVGCLDGSTFSADHIICTLPLGVLKNFAGHIFKPNLHQSKLSAIDNLGFGGPAKIYLEYDKSVRSWLPSNIRPLWSSNERITTPLQWTKQVVEISKLPKSKRVLEVRVGGSWSNEVEKLSDEEISNGVTDILRKCINNPRIPYPSSVLKSDWNSSACYFGGKPFFSTTSTTNDVNVLAMPLGDASSPAAPRLLFAGDATILNGFGCLDGARRSGIREAQRIVEFYNKKM